jgi:single-strand DNA-binding protein
MSTHFPGEGNIGSAPEFREFAHGNEEPRRLLRLNVYFDNPIPGKDGEFEDKGGFWAPVELWHRDAGHWQTLYQKGMRVLVVGRMLRDEWEGEDGQPRSVYKIVAHSVGILPHRIDAVTMSQKPQRDAAEAQPPQNRRSPRRQARRSRKARAAAAVLAARPAPEIVPTHRPPAPYIPPDWDNVYTNDTTALGKEMNILLSDATKSVLGPQDTSVDSITL